MGKMTFRKYRDHAMLMKYDSDDNEECVYVPAEYEGLAVTSIGDGAFRGSHMKIVVLPGTMESIGYSAFEGIYELQCIGLGEPKATGELPTHSVFPPSIRRLDSACFRNTGLVDITFTADVAISDHAFSGCRNLNGVVFFNSTGSLEGDGTFSNSGIRYLQMDVGEIECLPAETFLHCNRLERVVFKNLDAVGFGCFRGCKSLGSIIMLNGKKPLHVERGAFEDCINLRDGMLCRTPYDVLLSQGYNIYDVIKKLEREYHKDFSSVDAIICRHKIDELLEILGNDSYLNYRDTLVICYLGVDYQEDTWDYHYRFGLYKQVEILQQFQHIRAWSGRIHTWDVWHLSTLDVIRLSMFKEQPDAMEWDWSDPKRIFLSSIAGGAFERDPQEIAQELLYRYLCFLMGYIPKNQEMNIHGEYQFEESYFKTELGMSEDKINWLKARLGNIIPLHRELGKVYNKLKIKEE